MPLSTGGAPAPQDSADDRWTGGRTDVIVRDLASPGELAEACHLQEEIWGAGFSERVPAAILLVGQKIGGVTAGAFDDAGRLLGFVFGLTGVRDGKLVHWSDMLAVRESARGGNLGERLKQYQRDRAAALGVETMLWTFDPLVARNAHFNLNRLGARPVEYVANLYGSNTGSTLHGSLPTDRFIVEWDLRADGPRPAARGGAPSDAGAAPLVNPVADGRVELLAPLPPAAAVCVQVPDDVQVVQTAGHDAALAWRLATRRAFQHYLAAGYRVTGFRRGSATTLPFYVLSRDPAPPR